MAVRAALHRHQRFDASQRTHLRKGANRGDVGLDEAGEQRILVDRQERLLSRTITDFPERVGNGDDHVRGLRLVEEPRQR